MPPPWCVHYYAAGGDMPQAGGQCTGLHTPNGITPYLKAYGAGSARGGGCLPSRD